MFVSTLKQFFSDNLVESTSLVEPWIITARPPEAKSNIRTVRNIANAIGTYPSAIYQWDAAVPLMRAHLIVNLSGGQLAIEPEAYEELDIALYE